MGWNKLPTWVKGGIILAILDLILVLFAIISSHPFDAQIIALGMVQFPFYLLLGLFDFSFTQNIYTLAFGGLLVWFIIGSIIGWIVGKIKNR